jgi:hypothetical protein
MPASTSFQVIGIGKTQQAKLEAAVQAALAKKPGKWRVQFLGHTSEDVWEMAVSGPTVETTEYLDRTAGQLDPAYVADAVARIAG